MAFSTKTSVFRGLKTAWLSGGDKKKDILFFIHGFPDDPSVWKNQTEHFKKFHVVAPYVRGTGPSEPGATPRYGLDAVALDHLEILKKEDPTGKKKIILVGHDLGAFHAWHLAFLLGARLRGLVAINGAHVRQALKRLTNPGQVARSWYMIVFQLWPLADFLVRTIGPSMMKRQKISQGIVDFPESDATHAGAIHAMPQYRMLPYELWREARSGSSFKLKAPVLQISSLKDAFVLPTNLEELRTVSENPTVRLVDAHHWVMVEKPELVNRLMEKFING